MIENYGCSDVFFQMVRLVLLAALIALPIIFIQPENSSYSWIVVVLSVLVGSLVYFIIMTIFDLVMWYAGGFESLGVFDAIFLQDDD